MTSNGQKSDEWISLGEACRLLGVNQTTLRQWSDDGIVRVFRTPGGHRRYQRADLESVLRRSGAMEPGLGQEHESVLLRRIRRRLQSTRAAQMPWQANIDDSGRARMRMFGRRLLSLLDPPPNAARGRRSDVLQEAEVLGQDYGTEMARIGLSLRDTLSAFLFFRNTIPAEEGSDLVDQALDQVLLGIGSGYQRHTSSMNSPTEAPLHDLHS